MSPRKRAMAPWPAAWLACALLAAVLGVSAAKASAATYRNGVTLGVPGAIPDGDNAARFDGVDDQVNMSDPSSGGLDFGTGDFTVEGWIRTTSNADQIVASKQASGSA